MEVDKIKPVVIATIALVVGLVIGIGAGWVAKPAEVITGPGVTATATTTKTVTVTPPVAGGLSGEVKIGWIDGLTGAGAFWGEQGLAVARVAVEDVNQYLQKANAGWWLTLVVEDSETKPEVALEKLKSLHARGITIVGGIDFSADLKAMMSYANTNHILIVAAANSYELAIENDYIFRVLPNTGFEGRSLATLLREEGVKYHIPVWRGDAYADSVITKLREYCANFGIEVDDGIRYNPDAVEFSAEAGELNSKVQTAISKYGADKVSWNLLSFEEGKAFYAALKPYNPVGWGIKWLFQDGGVLCDWVIEDPSIAEMNANAKAIYADHRPEVGLRAKLVQEKVVEKLGRTADIYGLCCYDTVWLITFGLLGAGRYDATAVKDFMPMAFDMNSSIIGWAPMDKYGDKAGGDMGYYQVVKIGEEYKWARVGGWRFSTDTVFWLPEPEIVS